jgi:hypothetical protein
MFYVLDMNEITAVWLSNGDRKKICFYGHSQIRNHSYQQWSGISNENIPFTELKGVRSK